MTVERKVACEFIKLILHPSYRKMLRGGCVSREHAVHVIFECYCFMATEYLAGAFAFETVIKQGG